MNHLRHSQYPHSKCHHRLRDTGGSMQHMVSAGPGDRINRAGASRRKEERFARLANQESASIVATVYWRERYDTREGANPPVRLKFCLGHCHSSVAAWRTSPGTTFLSSQQRPALKASEGGSEAHDMSTQSVRRVAEAVRSVVMTVPIRQRAFPHSFGPARLCAPRPALSAPRPHLRHHDPPGCQDHRGETIAGTSYP